MFRLLFDPWTRLVVWLVIGLIIYAVYGVKRRRASGLCRFER
jgi:hypothetical protein